MKKESLPGRKAPINCIEELAVELMNYKPEITAYCFENRMYGSGSYLWFNVRKHTHVIKIDHEFTVKKWEEKFDEIEKAFGDHDRMEKLREGICG